MVKWLAGVVAGLVGLWWLGCSAVWAAMPTELNDVITTASTDVKDTGKNVMLAVLGIFVLLIGFGLVMRLVRKSAKAS